MKYIVFSLLLCIGLIIPHNSFAQTSAQNTACSSKKNGDACTYQRTVTTGGKSQPTGTATQTESGFCDRTNGDSSASGNPLVCKTLDSEKNGWEDCVVVGDACKLAGELGVCGASNVKGSKCDTTKKPAGLPGGTPGGSAGSGGGLPGGTPGGGTDGGASTGGTNTDASAPQSVGFVNPIRFNSIPELIAGIINALLGILGAITVVILVMSGFKYMTSSNPGEVGQALDGIRNAIVGLMIVMGAFLITQYIISALV